MVEISQSKAVCFFPLLRRYFLVLEAVLVAVSQPFPYQKGSNWKGYEKASKPKSKKTTRETHQDQRLFAETEGEDENEAFGFFSREYQN
jgi:hypothetical protein